MDTQLLKAFVTVVDQGSFSEAAETLHLTQPAVSKRLATLEQQLGGPLIERGARQLRLTDAGTRLLPHARRILDELHNARLSLTDPGSEVAGPLPLIASHHIGLHHLPAWLRRLNREHPAVNVALQFMDSESGYGQMRRRTAELAFVTLNDSMDRTFEVHASWLDPMAFVCSPDHPLAQMVAPGLTELARYDALLPEAGTATYRTISRLFLEADLTLRPQMPTNYLETIKVMTGVGLGWSVLPQRMVDHSLKTMPIPHPVTRRLGAVGLRGRILSPAAHALLAIVEDEAP
ncbi:LysR family transcriptional regulator [Tamilnaduibacter salinus]|uniref:LysR family transcriptional regulator n=1 Tax=Tamilnaduibacter salinus TaxID=1484056 RepID=A0A2U1CZN1_9GAMM|nr:LysR family transcriptional regulator [Tamilnaduibacter salinus]PVY78248.1 LysR family transcriptional regulator [Tamilnaduibacter salinus]